MIKLEYETGSVSSDGHWVLPDHVHVLQIQSCDFRTDSNTIRDMKSYQEILSREASVVGEAWEARFTASAGKMMMLILKIANCLIFYSTI